MLSTEMSDTKFVTTRARRRRLAGARIEKRDSEKHSRYWKALRSSRRHLPYIAIKKEDGSAMKKSELKELYQMMFPEYPDIVTVRQLREMLGISRQLAYDLINDGELQAIKIGNSFKIPKVSVINFVTEEKKEVKSSA